MDKDLKFPEELLPIHISVSQTRSEEIILGGLSSQV